MSSGVGGRGTFRCQVCGVEVYSWSGDYDYVDWATIKAKPQRKKIMIKNGLYALTATSRNGVNGEVGGVLILRDGQMHGGDAFVFYTGSYECSAGRWQGKMTNQEHTPTGRPMAAESNTSDSLAPIAMPVLRPMQWPSLASKVFDTMQRCACWWPC